MVKFLDGPAQDTTLALRRAPIYLRVVISSAGELDALDQLDDEAGDDETIHVYRRTFFGGPVHVLNRDRRGPRSGWYAIAEYRHLPAVDGEQLRARADWRAWCQSQIEEAAA